MTTGKVDIRNPQIIRVGLIIDGIKFGDLVLKQTDKDNPNWFTYLVQWGNCSVFVLAGSEVDGSNPRVCLNLELDDGYEIRREKLVKGFGDWTSVTWRVRPPERAQFLGEPMLPRVEIKFTLKLISGPHLPRRRSDKRKAERSS